MDLLSTSLFYRYFKKESPAPDIYKESIVMTHIIMPIYLWIRSHFSFSRLLPQTGLLLTIFILSFYNPVIFSAHLGKFRLGFLLLPAILLTGVLKTELRFPQVTPFDLPVFLLLLVSFLSLRPVVDLPALLLGLREIMSLCLFIMSIYLVIYLFTKKEIKRLFYILGLGGIGASLLFILHAILFKSGDSYLRNAFGNVNHFGYFLVLVYPIALVVSMDMLNSHRWKHFWFWRLGTFLIIGVILFIHSLGVWISLFFSFFILAIIFKKRDILIPLMIIILVGVLLFSLPPTRHIFLKEISLGDGSTIMARVEVWKEALASIYTRPILGVGLGQFSASAKPYYTKQMYNAFSVFFHLAATTGIFGLAIFLWLLIRAFKLNISLLGTDRTDRLYGGALLTSLTAGVAGFFWDTHILAVMTNWLLGILLGSCVVMTKQSPSLLQGGGKGGVKSEKIIF